MLPQDPHQLRRRIMLMVVIVLFPVACTFKPQCKLSASADVQTSCTFNISKPMNCIETVWLRLKCPF
jgi:hypothetical protein